MKRVDKADDPQRRQLIEALGAGLFTAGLSVGNYAFAAKIFGDKPAKLPPGQSIYKLSGTTLINGKEATLETSITPGNSIVTGKGGEIIFVVGDNAMFLRADSELNLVPAAEDGSLLFVTIDLVKGSLLAVCGPGKREVHTQTANIVLMGTGFYAESDPELTYFCTCYGTTLISAKDDPDSKKTVSATHHDEPVKIIAGAKNKGKSIFKAGFTHHTDPELCLIETLVGRTPPSPFKCPVKN